MLNANNVCQIYRIEHHLTGVGPYQGNIPLLDSMRNKHNQDKVNHPLYSEDVFKHTSHVTLSELIDGIETTDNWVFGFKQLGQLRKWFSDDDLVQLHKAGFNLVVYKSHRKNIANMSKQLAFNISESEVLFKQNVISLVRKRTHGTIHSIKHIEVWQERVLDWLCWNGKKSYS